MPGMHDDGNVGLHTPSLPAVPAGHCGRPAGTHAAPSLRASRASPAAQTIGTAGPESGVGSLPPPPSDDEQAGAAMAIASVPIAASANVKTRNVIACRTF